MFAMAKQYNWQEIFAEGEAKMLQSLFVDGDITYDAAYRRLLGLYSQSEADALIAEWSKELKQ